MDDGIHRVNGVPAVTNRCGATSSARRRTLRRSADRRGVGRTCLVEIRYCPLEVSAPSSNDDPDDPDYEVVRTETRNQTDAIVDAIRELEEPPRWATPGR